MTHWRECDHCRERQAILNTNGAAFCSVWCMTQAEQAAKSTTREKRQQLVAARERQEDQRVLLTLGLIFVVLCTVLMNGDQMHDEAAESRQRQALYARVSWEANARVPEANAQ